jgi:predicted Zn-dependent protease
MTQLFNREQFVARITARRDELLQDYVTGLSSAEQKLEIAVLTYELSDQDRAIELLQEILSDDPCNSQARVWLVCALMHNERLWSQHREILAFADRIAQESPGEMAGAALYFKACVTMNLKIGTLNDVIRILEESVKQAPNWVGNQHELASKLLLSGDNVGALEYYRQALKNMVYENPEWSLYQYIWESTVTYRVAGFYHRKEIEDRIEEIKKLIHS